VFISAGSTAHVPITEEEQTQKCNTRQYKYTTKGTQNKPQKTNITTKIVEANA
jgi:hypothetical protein